MNETFWTSRQGWYALALVALVSYLAFQGTRGMDNASEGRYAECARAMAASNDYITPRLNDLPHWTKPPLGYWVPAMGIELLGVNAWGARLGNALAGVLTVLCVAGIARALWGNTVGIAAGWVYLASPFPYFGAFVVTVDVLLTLFVAAAIWCYCEARRAPDRLGWILGFWLACGLGFMTKGPLVLLPLLPLFIWHHRSGRPCRLYHPAGLGVFALSGFWWYAVIFYRHPELFHYYWKEEMLDRMTGRVSDETTHNRQWYRPFQMYLPVLTVGAGAWIYYGGRVFAENQLWKPRAVWTALKAKSESGWLLLWLLLPLAVFFVAKSRLHLYVLPLYPAVALVCAHELIRRHGGVFPARKVLTIAGVTLALLITAKGVTGFIPRAENMEPIAATLKALPDADNTTFVAFEKSEVYALEYYLDGKLIHATAEDKKEAWEFPILDVIGQIKASPPEHGWVFIGIPKRMEPLEAGLEANGFHTETTELRKKKWQMIRVTGRPTGPVKMPTSGA